MARTTLTKTTPLGAFGTYGAGLADVTMTAADTVNLNQFAAAGTNLVIVQNTNAGAQTVTVTSAADERGRTGDITTYSLAAGDIAVLGPFGSGKGWQQSDGFVYLQASHADVKIGVIVLS